MGPSAGYIAQRVIQPEQQFGFSRLKGIVFSQIGINFLDSSNFPRVCDQRARTERIQLFHVGKIILAQAFYQFCFWICLGRRKPVKFMVCADFLQQFADRKAMGMGVFLFAPAGNFQRVLKRQQSLYLRRGKRMFHFQIVMELGEILQLINTANVL